MPGATRRMSRTRAAVTGRMTRFPLGISALCGALALTACQSAYAPAAPAHADLRAELVLRSEPGPPPGPDGLCWGTDVTPAVIETVTDQEEVEPATFAEGGTMLTPASYRSVTHQKIVQDRAEVWFRAPCPAMMTADFIATLQRALKARGLYRLALTGVMDAPTRDAIRRFQAPLGFDSPVLTLAAARDLGLVAADPGR